MFKKQDTRCVMTIFIAGCLAIGLKAFAGENQVEPLLLSVKQKGLADSAKAVHTGVRVAEFADKTAPFSGSETKEVETHSGNTNSSIRDEDIEWLINWRKRYFDQWVEAAELMHKTLVPGVAGATKVDVKWTFAKEAFADSVDLISPKQVQGVAAAVLNGLSKVDEEVDRARTARTWQSFSEWIAEYQRVFANQLAGSHADVRRALEVRYPQSDYAKRKALLDALAQKDSWSIPKIQALELRLFENWLNAQWDESNHSKGYVQIEWTLVYREGDQRQWTLNRCSSAKVVVDVFAERVAARVDKFIGEGDLAGIMHLRVNKKVCFRVQNAEEPESSLIKDVVVEPFLGPRKRELPYWKHCAWVAQDNSILDNNHAMGVFGRHFDENMKHGKLTSSVWWFSGCKSQGW